MDSHAAFRDYLERRLRHHGENTLEALAAHIGEVGKTVTLHTRHMFLMLAYNEAIAVYNCVHHTDLEPLVYNEDFRKVMEYRLDAAFGKAPAHPPTPPSQPL